MKLCALALVACALVCGVAAGPLPNSPDYECDPATCKPENNCQCASLQPPLDPQDTPQFVVFTHDDGIIPKIFDAINATVGSRTNPNGCPIPLTWFTIKYDTEPYCDLVKKLWEGGHEIALHTRDHIRLVEPIDSAKEEQMVDVRTWLNETCGIPEEDMVGMRDPFLIQSPGTRRVQHEMGLLYDSSINEHWTKDGTWATSLNGSARLWPYSMDNGIPQVCDATGPDGHCDKGEKWDGLWEVPVWVLQTSNYPMDAYAMDPGGDVFKLLQLNFDAAYEGNRAPVPIYMHMPWMTQEQNKEYVQKFMDYALGKPDQDVWFVTMHQLIDWMKNPIPASEMKARFNQGCQPGGANAVTASKSMPTPAGAPRPAAAPAPAPAAASPAGSPVAAPAPKSAPVSGAAAAGPAAVALLSALALALLL